MQKIFDFLRDTFSASPNFPEISSLISQLETGTTEFHQLAGCIAIDIRYDLVEVDEYDSLLTKFILAFPRVTLHDFHHFVQSHYLPKNCFSKSCGNNSIENIRILRRESFERYYGDSSSVKYRGSKGSYALDKSKILANGWGGKKDIAWITPYDEFEKYISRLANSTDRINFALDYVGFPRDSHLIVAGSPASGGIDEYVCIKYPASFSEPCFQPNATNADWSDVLVLFLSYNNVDGHGRTYNENGVAFAKEKIHYKSYFWDDAFKAFWLGRPTANKTTKANMGNQILSRFS
jgi:hypothetical protein